MKEYLIAFLGGMVVGGACNDCLQSSQRYQQHAEQAYVSRQEQLRHADEKFGHWKEQALEERVTKERGETYVIRR